MGAESTYNENAERSVIGSILMAQNVIPDVLERMRSDDFWVPRHQTIFEAAIYLWGQDSPVDAETVGAQLQSDGNLQKVGGHTYLLDCMQATPTAANVTHYAKIIADLARLRRLEALCVQGQQLVRQGGGEAFEVVEKFEKFLDESKLAEAPGVEGFGDLYDQWVEWMDEDVRALPTPWGEVNSRLAGGLQRQRLYIVGARPGCGKSVLLLNISEQIARSGYKGLVFSLEMPKMEVMSRMLAAGARVDYGELVARRLSKESLEATNKYMLGNSNFNSHIRIDDQPDHTLESISQIARAQKRRGLDFVCVDYIQLLNSSRRSESRYQELGLMSRQLKHLSRKLDIAVLVAAQLNRDPEKQNRLPSLADLRESGNLEADADVVMMLSRGDRDQPGVPLITLSVVKNRTGVMDRFTLDEHFEQARIGA